MLLLRANFHRRKFTRLKFSPWKCSPEDAVFGFVGGEQKLRDLAWTLDQVAAWSWEYPDQPDWVAGLTLVEAASDAARCYGP
jgi:hypothetical protein